jgi:hypothetical protein
MQSSAEQVLPPFASSQGKSIFESKTFWGAVSTALVEILPAISSVLNEFQRTGKIDFGSILIALCTRPLVGLALTSRNPDVECCCTQLMRTTWEAHATISD